MGGRKMSFVNKKKYLILLLVCCLVIITPPFKDTYAFSDQVIQRGAFGDDVIELQARLQYLGFYTGKIDGVFGWGTYWALRNFQKEFGLKVDGLAGEKTKAKLIKASKYDEKWVHEQIRKGNTFTHYGGMDLSKQTKKGTKTKTKSKPTESKKKTENNKESEKPKPTATNIPKGFSQNDIKLMANAVYGEARGEPYEGQVAVAAVILNRVESPSFPNTVAGVIFEPGAFTAVSDGQIWLTPDDTAKRAVLDAINGWDPTNNAIYYFNPETATSKWIWSRPQIKKIGRHIFCM